MSKQFIRTDKNGTKIYHDYTCDRCGGTGYFAIGVCNGSPVLSPYDGGVCWGCGGSGKAQKPHIIKEYTPEYRAILDARAAKRLEKKMAEAQAAKASKQAEWKESKGFVNDRIHVVGLSNSYELRDSIKAAGGRYNDFTGWYFSEPHDEFQTFEITAEDALGEDDWGILYWRNDIREKVEEKIKAKQPVSEHIGEIGDRVELEVTYLRTGSYDSMYGTTYIHSFEDTAGNILVWKTNACGGFDKNKLKIKGTVKEHSEYRGVKQTVLTRCKVA